MCNNCQAGHRTLSEPWHDIVCDQHMCALRQNCAWMCDGVQGQLVVEQAGSTRSWRSVRASRSREPRCSSSHPPSSMEDTSDPATELIVPATASSPPAPNHLHQLPTIKRFTKEQAHKAIAAICCER